MTPAVASIVSQLVVAVISGLAVHLAHSYGYLGSSSTPSVPVTPATPAAKPVVTPTAKAHPILAGLVGDAEALALQVLTSMAGSPIVPASTPAPAPSTSQNSAMALLLQVLGSQLLPASTPATSATPTVAAPAAASPTKAS